MAPQELGLAPEETFSLDEETAYAAYFVKNGFVVIRDALSPDRVKSTVDELWSNTSLLAGYSGLQRDDPETWDTDDWPTGSRNFLDSLEPFTEVESWKNRVDANIARAFQVVWEAAEASASYTADPGDSFCASVDRFGVMRPTVLKRTNGDIVEKPEWRTSRNWLHWDQNPWSHPNFFGVQGFVALTEGTATSGGFVTVPGFHRKFTAWGTDHPEGSIPKQSRATVPFPVPKDDEMQSFRVRVPVPAGAILAWDSRMPHENFPNSDEQFRVVQYITYRRFTTEQLHARQAAWTASIRCGLVPASFAERFTSEEASRLGMAYGKALDEAIDEGRQLPEEILKAAEELRCAHRLRATAIDPRALMEASSLFKRAFAANPALKGILSLVKASEVSGLPFWIL